ncbi:hypothetical protein P9B03_05960 [Metasolibacillus meyeri]|uniref:Phenylalanyl-tRNA synthetase subunit beta n=1 Tax=Metasolibacillus meyeri TaxID=1071052 RepID=A0AAW9NTE1_9BACL|nr:hypothetical protein [Metasolibacillus meyeri]MEC1178023.1 hypothetical protein [Metasolibacillus meyeri]
MRVIKFLLITVIVLGLAGYGVYHFGMQFISKKVAETVTIELADSGQIEAVKHAVEQNATLAGYMDEAKVADLSELPFTTKEEATKVLIQKVGVTALNDIRVKAENGTLSQEEIIQEIQEKLTPEEQLALKVIIYQELYK